MFVEIWPCWYSRLYPRMSSVQLRKIKSYQQQYDQTTEKDLKRYKDGTGQVRGEKADCLYIAISAVSQNCLKRRTVSSMKYVCECVSTKC
jgi:hypothetical protein